MTKIALLFSVLLALAGVTAAIALGDNPHPPSCKGDPHRCAVKHGDGDDDRPSTTTVEHTTTVTQTVTVPSTPPPAPQPLPPVVVTVPTPPHDVVINNHDHDHTIITRTIIRTRVKFIRLRTYCTMQRHGWKCSLTRPVKHRPLPKRVLFR